jgi:hypothetical protein
MPAATARRMPHNILQAVVVVLEALVRIKYKITHLSVVMVGLGRRIFIEQDRMYIMQAVEVVVFLMGVVMVQVIRLVQLVPVVAALEEKEQLAPLVQ